MNSKNITSLIINKHLVIVRYVIVLLAIMAVVSLFPKEKKFKYSDYEVNKPWKYENLYAPFDFSIKKLPDSLKAERLRAEEDFYPFYQLDENVQNKVTDRFEKVFNEFYALKKADTLYEYGSSDSLRHTDLALLLLDTIYQRGIWDIEQKKNIEQTKKKRVRLIQNGQVKKTTRQPTDFFTFNSASRLVKEIVKINKRSFFDRNAVPTSAF